jgi:hypothetical protein
VTEHAIQQEAIKHALVARVRMDISVVARIAVHKLVLLLFIVVVIYYSNCVHVAYVEWTD